MHPLETFRFCPRCGSGDFQVHDERSRHCGKCGFTYYYNSAAAVAAFFFDAEGRLLVVRRRLEPARGTLDLPGGFVDPDETLEDALRREVHEETRLAIRDVRWLFSHPNRYRFSDFSVATCDSFFYARVEDASALCASDDAAQAEWLMPSEIDAAAFGLTSIRRGVERFLESFKEFRFTGLQAAGGGALPQGGGFQAAGGGVSRHKKTMDELHRLTPEAFRTAPKRPIVLVLDNLRSFHNVGSCFRTADAFALREVCLCGISATPPSVEIHKTALGAEDAVAWRHFQTTSACIQTLKGEGYEVVVLEQVAGSVPLDAFPFRAEGRYAIVVGHEVYGVGEEAVRQADGVVEIPQYGTKHSLNVSVATGIVVARAAQFVGLEG